MYCGDDPTCRVGEVFNAVAFGMDYVEIRFNGPILRALTNPVIDVGGQRFGFPESGSKSEVSRICANLDEEVRGWLDRPLDHIAFRHVFLDATYVKARVGGTGPTRKAPG